MKSYKSKRRNRSSTRAQILVLALAVLVSIVLVGLGYSIRKLDQIKVELRTPGLMDLLKPQTPFVAKIEVNNPTMLPFRILPFSLELKNSENVLMANLSCSQMTTVKLLSTTEVPLTIELTKELKLLDISSLVTGGAVVEGEVKAKAFGLYRSVQIKKLYVLPKLF